MFINIRGQIGKMVDTVQSYASHNQGAGQFQQKAKEQPGGDFCLVHVYPLQKFQAVLDLSNQAPGKRHASTEEQRLKRFREKRDLPIVI
jgi:hypothetical protein